MVRFFYRYILPKRYRREYCKKDLAVVRKRYKFYSPPPPHIRQAIRELKQAVRDYWRV